MKLMYCAHCGDIVRLFREKRSCRCGKSWGYYEEDNATTVQTYPGLSLGIANPDFETALQTFVANPRYFSPVLAMRCWVNPLSEPDVTFVPGEDTAETASSAEEAPVQAGSTSSVEEETPPQATDEAEG